MVKNLAFKWVTVDNPEKTNDNFHQGYFDILISGQALRSYLEIKNNSPVTPFGFFLSREEFNRALNEYLLKQKTQLPNDRIELYICEKCGDILCGSVTAKIIDRGDKIVWELFAHQSDYDEIDESNILNAAPIEFDKTQYLAAFNQVK
jgi:hypothetical protein